MASTQSSFGRTGGSTEGKVPLGNYGQKVDKPTNSQIMEMCGMLKVRSSMLALGACERVKKIARHHNNDIAYSSILPELVNIVSENPDTPLAAGAISALCTIAMTPDGRQRICVMGGAPPVIKCVAASGTGGAMEARWHVLGADHPETICSIDNLAVCIIDQGRYQEAEPMYQQAVEAIRHHGLYRLLIHRLRLLVAPLITDANGQVVD
eukprot:gene17961-24366_t